MIHIISSKVRESVSARFNPEPYFNDFCYFCGDHLRTWDIDPIYPVLRHMYQGMDDELALWHSLCYISHYDLASGTYLFNKVPMGVPVTVADLTTGDCEFLRTGMDRRNLRGGIQMIKHLRHLWGTIVQFGGIRNWLQHDFTGDPHRDFVQCQRNVRLVYGNGDWAAHKTAEIAEKVHYLPIVSSDMGGEGSLISPTPRLGLEVFYGVIDCRDVFIAAAEDLQQRINNRGIPSDISEVETHLCDGYRLMTGRYYRGKDTDVMLATITGAHEQVQERCGDILAARKEVLPHHQLGELNNWRGVDKSRLPVYYYLRQMPHRLEPTPQIPDGCHPWHRVFNWEKHKQFWR